MADVVVKQKKVKEGVVVKVSGQDTISVEIQGLKRHSLYGKVLKHRSKYLVHDIGNRANVGDQVSIIEVRPLSKLKRWQLVAINGDFNFVKVEGEVKAKAPKKTKAEPAKSKAKKGARKQS